MALACPVGAAQCNDTSAVSVLLPFFPVALLLALALAALLARYMPRRPWLGWRLALAGIAAYVYFSADAPTGSIVGFAAITLGAAFVRGRRVGPAPPLSM